MFEAFFTIFALVWGDICVAPHMNTQWIDASEFPPTFRAYKFRNFIMNYGMVLQLMLRFKSKNRNELTDILMKKRSTLKMNSYPLSQILHLCGLSVECIDAICSFKFPFDWKFFPHWSQIKSTFSIYKKNNTFKLNQMDHIEKNIPMKETW